MIFLTKICLDESHWKHDLDIKTIERNFKSWDLTVEIKKALRQIQNKQSNHRRLEEWKEQAGIEIFNYLYARSQYLVVYNSTTIIKTMRSTEKHQYGKN